MKRDLFLWIRRFQLPLLLLLSVMPLLLIQLCIYALDWLPALFALTVAFIAASGACLAVSGAHRLPTAILGSALMLATGFFFYPIQAKPLLLMQPAALIILLFFSLPLALRQYESEVPPFVYVAGIAIHAVTQFLHHYFGLFDTSPYAPIEGYLTLSLVGYVLLFLLSMNRISLDNATLARHRLPTSIRRFNTVLTLAFTALALALAALPAVVHSIQTMAAMLVKAIAQLSAWLLSLFPSVPDMGGGHSGSMTDMTFFPIENTPPSAFALLMEKIASILSMMLLIGGTLFLIYLLFQQLRRLCRHLAKRLTQYISVASSEYDDEITDTREDGARRESRYIRRTHRRTAYDATPAGRIRQTYARLMHRHPRWAASSTARENLCEKAASLYELARYSDHPVTNEDADRFAAETRTF